MIIENFKVFQPYGNIVVDLFEYVNDAKETKYISGITYFLDEDGSRGITIMTDVHSDTALETLEQTLTGMGNLYSLIAAETSCYSSSTGERLNTYNLNQLYPDGFDASSDEPNIPVMLKSKTSPTVH